MKKMMLVDGNSLLFRGFYATIYGRPMMTSEGIYTNAVFAFANMLNKAINLIQPDALLVAFDSAKKNFRHEIYEDYKAGRKETPVELIGQFAIVREYLDAMNICRYELDGVEADDIIGSLVKKYPDYDINILSSDQDMLQLIDDTTSVWLLKKGISEIEEMNKAALMEKMGLTPTQVIDFKGLSGDKSDNIPGVPKVGEKTAIKLLQEFNSVEELLSRTEEIKGKIKENIIKYKDQALLSKCLATIKVDVELDLAIEDFSYEATRYEQIAFFQKYEMNSMIKKLQEQSEDVLINDSVSFKQVQQCPPSLLHEDVVVIADIDFDNPYLSNCYGLVLKDESENVYITLEDVQEDQALLSFLASETSKITYDVKMLYHVLLRNNLVINGLHFDIMIASFLCDTTITSLEKLQNEYQYNLPYQLVDIYGKEKKPLLPNLEKQIEYVCAKADLLYLVALKNKHQLATMGLEKLFYEIEMPLARILFEMEKQGVLMDEARLDLISKTMKDKVEKISARMTQYCDSEVNFNSPKQLAVLLFDTLGLKANKKRSTSIDILEKLQGSHPIIDDLIEYRKYQKLVSTYTEGLKKSIFDDGRIHTIYTQCVTQTGRLSSVAPNLQNISVRDEEGRLVRSAFIASDNNVLIAADYSQVELRILAHMAKEKKLIEAFNADIDVHTKTACELFDVAVNEVSSLQRRHAKAVNFGIVYGISDYGLAEQIQVSLKEAQAFIDKYFETYPNISVYMKEVVEFCQKNTYVLTLLNRRRVIEQINDRNYAIREFGKRAAMNAPIQGTAADLIKIAMIKIDKRMKTQNLRSKMILQVHDELIFDVVVEEEQQMRTLIQEEMENAMTLDVKLEVSIESGKNWYEAK